MENTIISYVAGVASLIAIAISIYNSLIEKRRLIAEVITKNRIEWIINVRNLVIEFLERYHALDTKGMALAHDKLSLYMNNFNPKYLNLLNSMKRCINARSDSRENIDEMIRTAQDVLSSVWTRMKREAGINRESEVDLLIKLHKEFEDGPIC